MKIKRKVKKHEDNELEKKIRQTWKESTSIPRPCILCEELTMGRGVFSPGNPQDFGAPDGGEAAFIFPICPMCEGLPKEKTLPLIRRVIFSAMKARTVELN